MFKKKAGSIVITVTKLLCLLFFVLTLSSCGMVTSKNPLGQKSSSIVDPNLPGIWYDVTEEQQSQEEGYLCILQRDDGYLKFSLFGNSNEPPDELQGYTSKINGEYYLNLQSLKIVNGKYEPENDYTFAHYCINQNNELSISLLNSDFFVKMIENGLIKGEIKKSKTDSIELISAELTDSTENLISLIRSYKKEEYLDEAMIFKKMRKQYKAYKKVTVMDFTKEETGNSVKFKVGDTTLLELYKKGKKEGLTNQEVKLLIPLLKTSEPVWKIQIGHVLVYAKDKDLVVPVLIETLKDRKDYGVSTYAAAALAQIGDPRAIEPIREWLNYLRKHPYQQDPDTQKKLEELTARSLKMLTEAEEKTPLTNEKLEKSLKELREITEKMRQIDPSFEERLDKMLKKSGERRQQFQDKRKCLENLRQISLTLHMYAADHDEKFPESLNDLYPKYLAESDILRCPAKKVTYAYVKGLTEFNSDMVIAYDVSVENHGDGRNVLFVAGYVKWHNEEEFQKLLQKTKDFLKSQAHGK